MTDVNKPPRTRKHRRQKSRPPRHVQRVQKLAESPAFKLGAQACLAGLPCAPLADDTFTDHSVATFKDWIIGWTTTRMSSNFEGESTGPIERNDDDQS